jgi:hypothetical protein
LQYQISSTGSDNGYGAWQTSPTFEGLTPDTDYWFRARYVAGNTSDWSDSEVSAPVMIKTAAIGDADPDTTSPGAIDAAAGWGGTVTNEADGRYTVTATAAGYVIDEVWVDGIKLPSVGVQGQAVYTTRSAPASSVFATFAHTINFPDPANGTLSVVRVGSDAAVQSGDIVRDGEVLRITAAPANGYELETLNAEGLVPTGDANEYTVLAKRGEAAPSITASFVLAASAQKYTITAFSYTTGNASVSQTEAEAGETVIITVTPAGGYKLKSNELWIISAAMDGNAFAATAADENTYSFVMPAYDVSVYLRSGASGFEPLPTGGPERDADGYYLFDGPEDIVWLSEQVLSGSSEIDARLVKDIDLSGVTDYNPIGYSLYEFGAYFLREQFYSYNGTFDGDGHTINVDIGPTGNRRALFAQIGSGVVKNLTVTGSVSGGTPPNQDGRSIQVTQSQQATGGIAAAGGSFYNCAFIGTVNGYGNTGGIVGTTSGTVENCRVEGEIINGSGIVGYLSSGIVSNCVNKANVSGGSNVGGIAGDIHSGIVLNCVNEGDVYGVTNVGGIVGSFMNVNGAVTNCVNKGNISGLGNYNRAIGGIVGMTSHGSVGASVNYGAVTGGYDVGGIVGLHNLTGTLSLNMNFGAVTAESHSAGGVAGSVASNGFVSENYNGGAVSVASAGEDGFTGGLIGYFVGSYSDNSGAHYGEARGNYNTGAVSGASGAIGPVFGLFNEDNAGLISDNYYAFLGLDGMGAEVNSANSSYVAAMLAKMLAAAGLPDEIKYNEGGYPVPERLWDGSDGEAPEVPVIPIELRLAFNVTPANASVELRDTGGEIVAPFEPGGKVYFVAQGTYSYEAGAPGRESLSDTVYVGASRTVTLALRPDDPEYEPGHDKARPSFGVYITSRDGATGTQIGNWNYDAVKQTYVDEKGDEAAFITDFTKDGRSPIVYSGVDMKPDARLGVVKKGILSDDIIAYYNANNGAYPDITGENYAGFGMKAATNSQPSEDPYTSNDPRYPGKWALPAAFDSFAGMTRYYYEDFLIGKTDWGGVEEYKAELKSLGDGTPVPAVIAITSYNDRVVRLPKEVVGTDLEISNGSELNAAIKYLLDHADTERALRNFEGMREDIYSLSMGVAGSRPLGGDGSYYIGSVWITPPYKTIATSVTGGKASIVLTGEVDSFRAAAGETVSFAVSTLASEFEVKAGDAVLTPVDGVYSFVMPDANIRIAVTLSGDGSGGDPGDDETPAVTVPNGTLFKAGEAQDFALIIAKDHKLFASLELGGNELVLDTDYTVEEGSTVITVSKSYMDRLPVGNYTLTALFLDGGSIEQSFSVETDPTFYIGVDPGITGGTVTASPTSAKAGESIALTVYTQTGYRLVPNSLKWDGRPLNADAKGEYGFTMPAWNVKLTVDFIAVETPASTPEQGAEDDAFKEGIKGSGDIYAGVWDGKSLDLRWFDPDKSTYTINTPAELAGLAALVNGLYNREIDTVAGKASYIHINTGLGDADGPQGNNKATPTYHYGDFDFADKTVYLGRDIDMGRNNNYMPIGGQYLMARNNSDTRVDASFNGVFDGRGHRVTIYADRHVSNGNFGDGSSVGLIGRLGNHDNEGAKVSGQAVKNVAVYGSVRANRSVGGVVGKIGKNIGGATIENCANFASISSTDAKGIGGIVGAAWNGGIIRNCYNAGTVNGTHTNPAGGIAGSVEIPIENSYSYGIITAPSGYAMGLGTNNGGAPVPVNSYYLTDSAKDGGWYSSGSADNSGERTSDYMKSDEFVTLLGSGFVKDTNNINSGYPVLRWQGGSAVSPPQAAPEDGSKPTVSVPSTTMVKDGEAITVVDAPDKDNPIGGGEASRLVVNVDTGGESVSKITAEMPAEFVKQASESKSDIEIRSEVASVLLPEKAVAELAAGGKDISVKAEKAETANTYIFTVESDGKSLPTVDGGIKAAIPAKDAGLGTVAVLVHSDGTSEIIKKSVIIEDDLLVPLSGSATIRIEDRSKSFSDVTEGSWYADAVSFAASRELFNGTSETEFSPNASMTRAMLVTVLYRLENEPVSTGESFSDVSADKYYANAAAWASENGIVTGIGDGLFAPNAEITREQLAAILYRYAGAQGMNVSARSDVTSFPDAKDVSSWAGDALSWAVSEGIITGRSNIVSTELAPKGTATRAEVAAMIMRFIEKTAKM